MNRKYTNRGYLDALDQKVLVYDGAMGTSLQALNLTAQEFGGEKLNGISILETSKPLSFNAASRQDMYISAPPSTE